MLTLSAHTANRAELDRSSQKGRAMANATPERPLTNRLIRLIAMAVVWGSAIYTIGGFLKAYWAPDA